MALSTARIHRVRGRPPLLAAGINSLIHSHSSSVRSLGYVFSFIYPFYTTHEDFSDRLSGAIAQESLTKNKIVWGGNFDVMLVTRHNLHRMPKGFNEPSLVCGLETVLPRVLKRRPQQHMAKGLWCLDAPEALTRHCAFHLVRFGDTLESILQRHCSYCGAIPAGTSQRPLYKQFGYQRTYPIVYHHQLNRLCHVLQS